MLSFMENIFWGKSRILRMKQDTETEEEKEKEEKEAAYV